MNCGIGFIAKAVHGARPYKDRFGELSYLIAGMKEMWSGYLADTFSFSLTTSTVNNTPITLEDQHCIICTVQNGTFGGGKMFFTPHSQMNDGLLDLLLIHGTPGVKGCYSLAMATTKEMGTHLYRDDCSAFRGTSVTFTNR